MKSHARVVVIGGGVVGVGTLYALTKKGWTDVVLLERNELTSGSTWHAAGLLPLFNMSYSVGKVHQYSLDLYSKLEEETGQHVGLRQVSNIRLAQTKDRWDEFMYYAGIAETIGVQVNILTPKQVKEIWPLCNTDGIIGAIQHPNDGYVQPADLTQAMAKGARDKGAQIYRQTRVIAIEQKANDEWLVKTDKGDITCEHLVTATGNFVRQTGDMLGLDIPVIPVEHQYIVTEPHPEIQQRHKDGLPEMGVLRDADSAWYMREEAGGLILGPYEPGAPVCYVDGPADDAEYELFQEDLERIAPHIESAFERVPAFGEVGIKKVYNGAICYTPDGSPIIGPAWGKRNLWLNEGHSFGVTAAGGAGWQLAEWIVEGESSIDMLGVDPRRFGPYASRGYLKTKNEEAYRNVFTPHYPDEERWDARPLKTSPCYDRMKALGAVFGSVYGWERPNWFAPSADYGWDPEEIERPDIITRENFPQPKPGEKVKELWSFRRSNYFEHVGNEVKNVTENCGVLDMSAFAKYEVTGPKAAEWLDSILANRVPKGIGRVGLCHLLTKNGGVRSEFTVYKRADNDFYLVGPGAWERHDWDYLTKLKPESGVNLQKITTQMGVLVLAGPKSRDVLQKLTDTDLSNDNFKWLTGKFINVGIAQAHALRVNFVGELGWELHHPIEMQNAIFDLLMEAGKEFGIKPFGIRAMGTMAVEKSYRLIGRELSVEYSAYESGLDRFVHPNKGDFIGRDELVKRHAAGDNWTFVTMEVHGIKDCDARGSEAIYAADGKTLVGRVTTGSYGWRVGKSLALAMVKPDQAAEGNKLKVRILGELFDAIIIPESPFDADNERLRA